MSLSLALRILFIPLLASGGANVRNESSLISPFLAWLDSTAQGQHPSASIEWYGREMGFGVRADRDLREGDVLVRLPLYAVACMRTLLDASGDEAIASGGLEAGREQRLRDARGARAVFKYVAETVGDERDALALWLMRERALASLINIPDSESDSSAATNISGSAHSSYPARLAPGGWGPYLALLPRAVHTPSTWPASALSALQDPRAVREARELRQGHAIASGGGKGGSRADGRAQSLIGRYNRLVVAIRELFRNTHGSEGLAIANVRYVAHELDVTLNEAEALISTPDATKGRASPVHFPVSDDSDEALADIDLTYGDGPFVDSDAAAEPVSSNINGNAIDSHGTPIETSTARIHKPSTRGLPGFGLSHDSLQSFVWAATLVDSRALTIRGAKYLVPFADFLNFAPVPVPDGGATRAKADGGAFLRYHELDETRGYFTVRVDRAVAAGAQVFEDYGDSDSSLYLQYHGMVPLHVSPFLIDSADENVKNEVAEVRANGGVDTYSSARSLGVSSANPFDCLSLELPPIGGTAPPQEAPSSRFEQRKARLVAIAQAVGLGFRVASHLCLSAPSVPLSYLAAVDSVDQDRMYLEADPTPTQVHQWLAASALSDEDAASSSCDELVRQHEARKMQRGKSSPQRVQAATLQPPSLALVSQCLLFSPASNKTLNLAPPAHFSLVAALLHEQLSAFSSSLADDSYALRLLATTRDGVHMSAKEILARASYSGSVSRVLRELSPLDPLHAWLALSYRTSRKLLITSLLSYFERTGPWSVFAPAKVARPAPSSTTMPASQAAAAVNAAALRALHSEDESKLHVHDSIIELSPPPPVYVRDDELYSAPPARHVIPFSQPSLVHIGLAALPDRDAAQFFTEEEHEAVKLLCDSFNAWFAAFSPHTSLVRAAPVGRGMRLGALTTQRIAREEIYLAVPLDAIMDLDSANSCPLLGPALKRLRRRFPGGDELHELIFHLITETVVKERRNVLSSFSSVGILLPIPQSSAAPASRFGPYIDLLPDTDRMPFPCFFLDIELAYLRGSPLEDVVRRYRADVERKFAVVKSEVLSQDALAFPPWAFNLETYQWATAILDSRSIWWGGRRHLVPLLDLINCAESENPERVHSTQLQRLRPPMGAGREGRGYFVLDKGVEYAVTLSDREYESSGMQLWENYGQPNWVRRLTNTHFIGYGLFRAIVISHTNTFLVSTHRFILLFTDFLCCRTRTTAFA